ncbi:hypothetical protein OAH81_01060 [Candidatus Pseudothioglobus singularis]|nr:hypothetical protein [Candidatus Pseudothioglobus singularis]MDB4821612.1 hypothetical protein [Candidatus Pseudothioglobus singularis]
MAVFCEFISLIILRDSIDKYFPGGWKRFVLEVPNRSMATDEEVVRVGFMNPADTNIYLEFLKGEGLQYRQSGDREIDDISDLDQFMGHSDDRQWLEFGDRVFNESKYFCAWKKGSLIDTIARPSDAGQMMTNVSPEIFNERFKYLRTENGLEIYSDTKYTQRENFLPEGMSIEEHYEYYSDCRKERENRTNQVILELEKGKDDNLIEKQKAQDLIEAEERKVEDDLYTKIAKALKLKTVDRSDSMSVMERLIEHAIKTNNETAIDLIDEFWHDSGFGFLDYEAGDDLYASVDPHEVIVQMKFYWEHYVGSDEFERDEMSEEEIFNIFKGMVDREFEESGSRYVKKIGKYFLSAFISDPREGRFTGFQIHMSEKEINDQYKNSGDFYMGGSDEGIWDDQVLKAFYDEHFSKPHHLDNLLEALIHKEGVEAATVKFNETIKRTIADDKKPMMYSISIEQLMDDFEEILKENGSQSFETFKELLEMDLGDYLNGHIALRHHNYVMTADWSMFSECSSFKLFYGDWGMNNYYRDDGLILLSLDEQYPPLNYTDDEMRELYDKCFKKPH